MKRSYLLDYHTAGPDTVTFLRAPGRPEVKTDFVSPGERTGHKAPMPRLRHETAPATAYDVLGIAAVMLAVGFALGYYFGR